jgi:hypothetical protein
VTRPASHWNNFQAKVTRQPSTIEIIRETKK